MIQYQCIIKFLAIMRVILIGKPTVFFFFGFFLALIFVLSSVIRYGIFEEGNDDVLDPFEWRYVHSLTQIYDGEADQVNFVLVCGSKKKKKKLVVKFHLFHQELEIDMRYNATFPPQYNHPGTFKLLLFLEDGYDVGAEVEFEIAGYDECGELVVPLSVFVAYGNVGTGYDVTPCASAADCNDNGECVEG